ncbi:MAG: class I SAM-dependent methyltransferase [Methylococcales bacterium]|nr:class I SAM-dependent methyltransferase [Methylococcales bacterium]MDD5755065.1 class I SAM-dependent methyltransferase [Methylococcales bacterium]
MKCRHCFTLLNHTFLDLGFAPPSNAYLSSEDLVKPEKYYPLKVMVCTQCWLVQTLDYARVDELFSQNYAYFSSTSVTWLAHAQTYTKAIIQKLQLNQNSFVIEIASNDGYLLKNFVTANIPCLGIEPTTGTAAAAEKLDIPVKREFFSEQLGKQLAASGKQADLIIGNNVYAHVPNINDFTRGLKAALKPDGTITLEFPHLMRLIEFSQFDTIYHEHFSYLSLYTVNRIFKAAGLRIWDVEELSTHGGSLRIYGCHFDDVRQTSQSVDKLLVEESQRGLQQLETYQNFQPEADKIKDDLLLFLIEQKRSGKKVVAYGAAAKGNTLLNYAGIKSNLIAFVCDAAPSKQNKFMPGSHISIVSPKKLQEEKPDWVLILPWNIASEIKQQNIQLAGWGTRFIIAVPKLEVNLCD